MINIIIYTIITLSILGLLLALVLFLVARKFKVEEDPRIDQVEAVMPGANCGGCGYAGCRAFAENVVKSNSLDGFFCPVGGNDVMKKVADTMGYSIEEKAPKVAVVRCNGNCEARPKTSVYDGISSCSAIKMLYQGDTNCKYGCLGQGDCVEACNFNALSMNLETGLPEVNEDNCVSCGACVTACPQGIIELRNKGRANRRVYVACMNQDKGGVARKACTNACIGCKKCEQVCPFDAIKVENFLSYIDYDKCRLCRKCVDVCPTGAILTANFPIRKKKEQTEESKPIADKLSKKTEA